MAEAFTEVAQEFRAGDRVQFTRNNYRADRLNGQTAEVVAIDPSGSSLVLQREDGTREMGTHINVSDGADNGAMRAWAASMPA